MIKGRRTGHRDQSRWDAKKVTTPIIRMKNRSPRELVGYLLSDTEQSETIATLA